MLNFFIELELFANLFLKGFCIKLFLWEGFRFRQFLGYLGGCFDIFKFELKPVLLDRLNPSQIEFLYFQLLTALRQRFLNLHIPLIQIFKWKLVVG